MAIPPRTIEQPRRQDALTALPATIAAPPAQQTANIQAWDQRSEADRRAESRRRAAERIRADREALTGGVSQAARSAWGSLVEMPVQAIRDTHFTTGLPNEAARAAYFGRGPADQAQVPAGIAGIANRAYNQTIQDMSRPVTPQAEGQAIARPAQGEIPATPPGAPAEQQASEPVQQAAEEGTLIPNRIVRTGNSFSANQRIGPGATVGSTDRLLPGQADDGRELRGMTVGEPGDAQRAMESWQRASQIRALTRMEQANPNPLTVVRDTGMGGFEGQMNRRLNQRDAEIRQARTDQHRQNIAQARQSILDGMTDREDRAIAADERAFNRTQQLAQEQRAQLGDELTRQQVAQGQAGVESAAQLNELRRRVADPSLTQQQRAEAERAYQALTSSGRDRYILQDVIMGYDQNQQPIVGRVALDTVTGQQVGQGQQSMSQGQTRVLPQEMSQQDIVSAARSEIQQGVSRRDILQRLAEYGLPPETIAAIESEL